MSDIHISRDKRDLYAFYCEVQALVADSLRPQPSPKSSNLNTTEAKNNHLSSTFTSWDRYCMFDNVTTSFRDVIPSCEYDNNNNFEFSSTKEITEMIMESALEHICRLRWMKQVSWRHVVISVTLGHHVMTKRHHANTYNTIIVWNSATEMSTEINMYHHFRTWLSWCDLA